MSACPGGDRVESALRAGADDASPALVAYLTAGYPTRERFVALAVRVAAACEVVEVGVPFSDPMADGPTIQRASRVALENGVDLRWILATVGALTPRLAAPIVLMSYVNPLLAYGLERLAQDAVAAGVAGFVVPDLPIEESGPFDAALAANGLASIRIVSPVTPDERLDRIARASRGFVYAVTSTGVTGGGRALPATLADHLARVRARTRLPVCAGFGIRTPEQVRSIAGAADGVVVGSALIEEIERGGDPVAFLRGLRPTARRFEGGRP